MSQKGKVYYGEVLAGMIAETDDGYEFTYDTTYLSLQAAKPVSLTLPLRAQPYRSTTLFSFFDGLIPEGWLLDIAKEHWKIRTFVR